MLTAGVDIGGTKVLAALVAPDGTIVRRVIRPTDRTAGTASILDTLGELLEAAAPGERPAAVGVAAAALVDQAAGRIASAPNLTYGVPAVAAAVRDRFGLPALLENDANAAAWAERLFGAGAGADNVVMVTVGTGVGGGAVVGGRVLRGWRGFAGEFGHITVLAGGPVCGCGQGGCLESFASGTAIGRLAREGLAAGATSSLQAAYGPGPVSGVMVSRAAEGGDAFAISVLAEAGRWLGVGLASLVNAFDPEVIVIGGGGAGAGHWFLDAAREELGRRVSAKRPPPPVVVATLGNEAGAIGAAALARAAFEGAPAFPGGPATVG